MGDGCGHSFLFQKKKLLKLILPKLLLKNIYGKMPFWFSDNYSCECLMGKIFINY